LNRVKAQTEPERVKNEKTRILADFVSKMAVPDPQKAELYRMIIDAVGNDPERSDVAESIMFGGELTNLKQGLPVSRETENIGTSIDKGADFE
jgi:hypothetical protein